MVPLLQRRGFPRSPVSVSEVRAFAVHVLGEWGVTERLSDVELCLSELATNALLHGVPAGREFGVTLALDASLLRAEVRDSGDGTPVVDAPDCEQMSGRGLYLVQHLADGWGFRNHVVGKSVWCEFKFDP